MQANGRVQRTKTWIEEPLLGHLSILSAFCKMGPDWDGTGGAASWMDKVHKKQNRMQRRSRKSVRESGLKHKNTAKVDMTTNIKTTSAKTFQW